MTDEGSALPHLAMGGSDAYNTPAAHATTGALVTDALQTPGLPQFGDPDPQRAYNRVFFALLRIGRTVMPGVEKALRDIGIVDPIWYEILLATEEAGVDGIQMLALQRRLFVAQYALSRHVARIEKAGLIRRAATGGAGRGQTLHLTEQAKGLHHRVWQVYAAEIDKAFGSRMTTDEAYALVRVLNRLYP